jgi:DNA-binding NarL/FixJ family response regulator
MSLTVALERPALNQLIRHAHLFGTECVYETGEQKGLPSADLARLRIELDALDAGRKSRLGFSIGKRRRRSSDETRAAALVLSVDGFVPKAIADKLGISDRTVRSYLKQSGATAYEGVQDLPKAA